MSTQGFLDWKGKPVNKQQHGRARATYFICIAIVLLNLAYIANLMNLVTYLHGTVHEGVANSSTMVTNWFGATCAFSLLGAFVSDSYITRFKTMLIFGPLVLLGYGLLALQAHFSWLHPPRCNIDRQENNCEQLHGWNAALLYIGMYMVALGEGFVRSCAPSLGGDQFDGNDPVEVVQKSSFFNWFTISISIGGITGLILVVWVQNNKGWDIGFGVCALAALAALLVFAGGFPFYRNQIPDGSPLTRMMQVLVAAFRKRNLPLPENPEDLNQIPNDFKFLDKAAVVDRDTGPWSLCTATQVEETKFVLRMLPIFITSLLGYMPNTLLLTFVVQQGTTMNTRFGKIHISPASLFVIPQTFQLVMLVIYDHFIVPFLRRFTGYVGGITHLQRVGIGFVSTALGTCAAALVEKSRLRIVEEHGLQDSGTGVPMSVFWLLLPFFFVGVVDVTSFVGLLEFFNSEAPRGMKSIGTSIFWCVIGLSSFLGTITVNLANKASRHGDGGRGWIEGSNLNKSHLDRFYWLLCVLQMLAFLNFLYWARRYVYRENLHIPEGKNPAQSEEMAVMM